MRGDLLEAESIQSIVGGFFDIYNYFGYGLGERVYGGALEVELRDRGHIVMRELVVDVRYKGCRVAGQRLDMVIDDRVIVENKATEKLCPADRMQLISNLRTTTFQVGILLHFDPAPTFERVIECPKKERPTGIIRRIRA